jgi:hypothetical protein
MEGKTMSKSVGYFFGILIFLCLLAGIVVAADHYIFVIEGTNDVYTSSFVTQDDLPKQYTVLKKGKAVRRVRLEVTEAQYNAGFAALPQAVIDAGKADAEDEESDYDQWNRQMKAAFKTVVILCNKRFGTNNITKAEFKTEYKKHL